MGSSISSDNPVSESIGFKSCLYSLNCEKSHVRDKQDLYANAEKNVKEIFLEDLESSTSEEDNDLLRDKRDIYGNAEKNVKQIFLEDFESFTSEEDSDLDDSIVKELGSSLCETLHIQDDPEPLCIRNPTLNQGNLCSHLVVDPHFSETDLPEGSNRAATILFSELGHLDLLNSDVGDRLSCTTVEGESFPEAENLAFMQPLPTTKQLISALKGGRAQHGIHLNEKLNVKWAPDVYDPPVTSAFHTVKRHHRQHHPHQHSHHRAKPKKDYPNRHSKGKVAKGVVSERKHAYRKSGGSLPSDPRTSRLHAFRFNSCGQSKIESLDLAVGSYETIKYGSSCYMESLSPLPIPVAKAS